MIVRDSIHCGTEVWKRERDGVKLTLTEHAPQTLLPDHAHEKPHWVEVTAGAFLERVNGKPALRVIGDQIFYDSLQVHFNLFGQVTSRCLNVEGRAPQFTSDLRQIATDLWWHDSNLPVSAVAERLQIHPVSLARKIGRDCGHSPAVFRNLVRIRKASHLVISSDLGLGAIALESGFYDQSHLARALKNLVGFTPTQIRRFADA